MTWWLDGVDADRSWQQSDRWPGIDAPRQTWHLARGASSDALVLTTGSSRDGEAKFRVDYDVGTGEYFAFWVDSQHGRGLSFTSDALESGQALVGFPIVHLTVSSSHAEPVVFVYLEELDADGAATVLASGRLAAAYRHARAAPYETLGLPWHAGLAADHAPLERGEEVELSFALTPVSRVLPGGHRLRLVVTGADPRQRNLADLRIDPAPTIALALGGRSGARIELPLAPLNGR